MGLKILTVKTVNSSSALAGSVLFNSKCVFNDGQTTNTDDTFFSYALRGDATVADKYVVDEALATFDDVYSAASAAFMTLSVYEDVNDDTSSTTSIPIDSDDIVKGVALGSDATKSILWIESNGKLTKILVNKALATIEDYIGTGTTTTAVATTTTTTP